MQIKKMLNTKKKIYLVILIVVIIIIGVAIIENKDNKKVEVNKQLETTKYSQQIEVECEKNLLFSKYDVDIYVDNKKIGTLDHGCTDTYETSLEEGKHTLRVAKKDDNSIDGITKFEVSKDNKLRYKISCTNSQVEIKEISQVNPPITTSDLNRNEYNEISDSFKNAGFKNVKGEEIKDLNCDDIDRNLLVEKITINDNDEFTKNDSFFDDCQVIIKYHTFKEINPPDNSSALKKLKCDDIVEKFKAVGFKNIETTNEISHTYKDGEIKQILINDKEDFSESDMYPVNAKIVIYSYKYEDLPKSSENSSNSNEEIKAKAMRVFEKYGKYYYPDGFKCHWIMNCLAIEVNEDKSCFIKVGVTIKNASGQKRDAIAQGTVNNSTVTDFYVN